ncbi:MAG TPA: hypothetical protein VEA69_06550, partial [Tepidisphaeraceae bacterium]|nr:hypothetical protein [Tepidisphaeraceae bacterium]
MRKRWVSQVTLALACAIATLPVAAAAPAKPVTLDLTAVPLADAIARWEKVAGAKADVAWPTMEELNKDTPVTLRVRDLPADVALRFLFRAARGGGSINVWRDAAGLHVTGPDDGAVAKPVERTYDLAKLGLANVAQAGGGDPIERLQRLIMEMVAADTWRDNGGAVGSIRVDGRSLVISTTPMIHDELTGLLGKLRDALADRAAAADPLVERARRALAQRMAAGAVPADAATLAEAVAKWQAAAGVNVVVDWRVLEAAGVERGAAV